MTASDPATPGVWPVLRYQDSFGATRFLCDVLGFENRAVMVDEDSVVVFWELFWTDDSGVILAGSHDLVGPVSHDLETAASAHHLVSHDVDAVYQRVLASDALVLRALDHTRLGGRPTARAFTLRDPWGNIWTVSTRRGAF